MSLISKDIIVDGHRYSDLSEVPNLGSLVGMPVGTDATMSGMRTYKGLYDDKDKLPHYSDLRTGSDALLVDSSEGLHYLFYEKTSDTWYEC